MVQNMLPSTLNSLYKNYKWPSLLDDGSVETSGTGLDGTRHWSNWRTDPDVAFRRQKRTGGCLGMSSSCEKSNLGSYRYRDVTVPWLDIVQSYDVFDFIFCFHMLVALSRLFLLIICYPCFTVFFCFRLFWCQITTVVLVSDYHGFVWLCHILTYLHPATYHHVALKNHYENP